MNNKSDCNKCQWSNLYIGTTDGSAGAAKAEHDTIMHPGHDHVFTREAPEGYEWAMRPFYAERGYVWCVTCNHMSDEYTVGRRGWSHVW